LVHFSKGGRLPGRFDAVINGVSVHHGGSVFRPAAVDKVIAAQHSQHQERSSPHRRRRDISGKTCTRQDYSMNLLLNWRNKGESTLLWFITIAIITYL
jgi:hypothetical protein